MASYSDVAGDKSEYEGVYEIMGQFIHESGTPYNANGLSYKVSI